MSLTVNSAWTKNAKRRGAPDLLVVYKGYDSYGMTTGLQSPYQGVVFNIPEGREARSNRKSTRRLPSERTTVRKGFHVYFTAEDAYHAGRHVVTFVARKKDLVAVGTFSNRKSAVFTKLFVVDRKGR